MMTFQKPSNIKYTDMAIYIDENIYKENFDVNTIYQYLYLLIYMLASHHNILKHKYLDSFSIFAASKVYFRLTNPDQFVEKAPGVYKLEKVKSVLNYIKSSLYFLKVDFEQSEYYQGVDTEECVESNFNYDTILENSISSIHMVEFDMVMRDASKTCEAFLSKIPYPNNTSKWHCIYISVLLTLINSITLNYNHKKRVGELISTGSIKEYHYKNFYEEEGETPILYGLPISMGPYVLVLSRELRRILGRDLSEILQTKVDENAAVISQFEHIVKGDETFSNEY